MGQQNSIRALQLPQTYGLHACRAIRVLLERYVSTALNFFGPLILSLVVWSYTIIYRGLLLYTIRKLYSRVFLHADGIVSYSMPQGDKRTSDWEFYDATYDGIWNEELILGLGQLTDGKFGPPQLKMGYYDYDKSEFRELSRQF